MLPLPKAVVHVLESLAPHSTDEWEFLKEAVNVANSTHQAKKFIASLPREHHTLFHAFTEALDIYESIHRRRIAPEQLTSQSIEELRKIRDLCLSRSPGPY